MRGTIAMGLAMALSGCGMSAAQRCYVGAGFERNPVVRELRYMRCDEFARDERARRQARQQAEDDARARRLAEMQRQHEAEPASHVVPQAEDPGAAIRAAPESPEIEATPAEAAILCERQGAIMRRGEPTDHGRRAYCVLGAATLFSIDTDGTRLYRVDTFMEGAEIDDVRSGIESFAGPPTEVIVDDAGLRVWIWRRPGRAVGARLYSLGVVVSAARSDEAPLDGYHPL